MKMARELAVVFSSLAMAYNVLAEEHPNGPFGTNAIAQPPVQSNPNEVVREGRRPQPRTILPSKRDLQKQLEEVDNMLLEYEEPLQNERTPTNAAYAAKWLKERQELKERRGQLVWEIEELVLMTNQIQRLVANVVAHADSGDAAYFAPFLDAHDQGLETNLIGMIRSSDMLANYQWQCKLNTNGTGRLNYRVPSWGCYFNIDLVATNGEWSIRRIGFCR